MPGDLGALVQLAGPLIPFVVIGFAAQLVDGALGMAFGVIASSALMALGVPPAFASAAVHAAEIATTGVAGASHLWQRNVDRDLFVGLVLGLVGGGCLAAPLAGYVARVLPPRLALTLVGVVAGVLSAVNLFGLIR